MVTKAEVDKAEPDHVAVPLELIKAVAHIGVDFGYGVYELEPEHIAKAREIYEANTNINNNGRSNG